MLNMRLHAQFACSSIATLRLKIAHVVRCDHDLATLPTQEDNKQLQIICNMII